MERYVNIGSPSGFSEIHTTSFPTSAKGANESFYLCGATFPSDIKIEEFGVKPNFADDWQMLIHPDMMYNPKHNDLFSICTDINLTALQVAPTASSRTVKILDSEGWFLKLNYKGMIGRIDRTIGWNQALSAVEVSNIISNAIDSGKLPKNFFFMREPFARVVYLKHKRKRYEYGIVFREPFAYSKSNEIKYLIPAFSLFSKDDKTPNDPTILNQLINNQSKSVEDFLFEDIFSPLYESYFKLLLTCGLELECHAQNTLFAIGEDCKIVGVVAKDGESIDKDLSLMEQLNIQQNIQTTRYKCLRKEDSNYRIMHSFMFDFKLGEYLVKPIIEDALKNFSFDKEKLVERIKEHNNIFIAKLPGDFFPLDKKWYYYDNIVHDRKKPRPYIGKDNPNYR